MNLLISILLDALLFFSIFNVQECNYINRTSVLFRCELLTKLLTHIPDELTIGIRHKLLNQRPYTA